MSGGMKFWVRAKNPKNFERRKKLFHITLTGKKEIWPKMEGGGKTILLISRTLRAAIRLNISIMGLNRTFTIVLFWVICLFMLSSITCGFRWTISSIWFDVSCSEIPPRLSTVTPSPWIQHWCASKLKFQFFDLINFNKLLNKWTKTINVSCLSPLIELTNHMRSHSVWLSTAPKLEKWVTCPRSISKNQTLSAWNLLCLCHWWRRIATYISGR